MKKGVSYRIGRFKIIRRIGKGAQGTVFLAKDPYLQRYVAIKVLNVKTADQKARQGFLLHEASAVGKLKHPNIVPIFEAEESKGIPYLVFEYVHGQPLKLLLDKGRLPISQILRLATQILDGIAYAHQNGIIHRDLKPSNILISKEGVPRITDFGISLKSGADDEDRNIVRGSLPYMAPEYFSERPVNPSSDIFSMGLILYEMLAGEQAIDGDNDFAIIYKILYEPCVAPSLMNPNVDKKIDSIVLKALQKEQKARYPDATAMKQDIKDYLEIKNKGGRVGSEIKETHSTVDFLLRRMQHKTDFPAFSASILEINEKTSSDSNASANEIANTILKDYALTNKILKLANSAFYRQIKGGVSGIKQAVVILGFEQIRLAASSLMLFSHFGTGSSATEIRDAMIKSFMSGIIARDVAVREGIKKLEVEFICSMFHNLGKNLTIFYFPEEYAEVKRLMAERKIDIQSAALDVLGISLDELGVSVAREWKFPESIVYSMRSLPEGVVEEPRSILDRLRHIAVFANELCEIASSTQYEEHEEPFEQLVQRFRPSFNIPVDEVIPLLNSAIKKMRNYASILDINPEESPLIKNLLRFDELTMESRPSGPTGDESVRGTEPAYKGKEDVPPSRIKVWQRMTKFFNKNAKDETSI